MPPPPMQVLHARRTLLLILMIGVYLFALIGLFTPPFAHRITRHVTFMPDALTLWLQSNFGINGMFGIDTYIDAAYLTVACIGLTVFTLSIITFIAPRHTWRDHIFHMNRPRFWQSANAAFIAGLLAAGYVATCLELLGCWSQITDTLAFNIRKIFLFQHTFYIALAITAGTAVIAFLLIHRTPKKYDRFIQMIIITYLAFVAAGVLMVFACAIQIYYLGLEGAYRLSGAYTGAGIGFAVMLWTLTPSLVLIYYGEYYRRATTRRCLRCAYNIRGVTSETCPECGAPINHAAYTNAENAIPPHTERHGLAEAMKHK